MNNSPALQLKKPTKGSKTKQASKARCWMLTEFNTKYFKTWKKLDLSQWGIRYLIYQLERCPLSLKLHIQGYIEFYKQVRMTTVKKSLTTSAAHLEPRKGTRVDARDYCMKDESPWFCTNHPDWVEKGTRVVGTRPVILGIWGTRQGQRTSLQTVSDLVKQGASEIDIFDQCPEHYLRYHGGIQRARHIHTLQKHGRHNDVTVHVLYGQTRSGKTRYVKDKYGAENIYEPAWNGEKYWFTDYDGEKILLINEFYGQARTSYMQNLLDNYHMRLDGKCTNPISNWDKIYITSNVHPDNWWKKWENIPQAVEDSFIERISTIKKLSPPKNKRKKTWADIPSELPIQSEKASSITLLTSEPSRALPAKIEADISSPSNELPNLTTDFLNHSSNETEPASPLQESPKSGFFALVGTLYPSANSIDPG